MYDGDCGFCNKSVQFILKHERKNKLYFAALQSEVAQKLCLDILGEIPDLSTFLLYENGKFYKKSQAFFKVLPHMKFPWNLLIVYKIIPSSWSNKVYDWIAKRRKKIAGEFCMLPAPEQRVRFLR